MDPLQMGSDLDRSATTLHRPSVMLMQQKPFHGHVLSFPDDGHQQIRLRPNHHPTTSGILSSVGTSHLCHYNNIDNCAILGAGTGCYGGYDDDSCCLTDGERDGLPSTGKTADLPTEFAFNRVPHHQMSAPDAENEKQPPAEAGYFSNIAVGGGVPTTATMMSPDTGAGTVDEDRNTPPGPPSFVDELRILLDSGVPGQLAQIEDSTAGLERVAAYIEANYIQSPNKDEAFAETKRLVLQSVASVAYYVNTLSTAILRSLEMETMNLSEKASELSLLEMSIRIGKEKAARREIGKLTTNWTHQRRNKITILETEERNVSRYQRTTIDFSLLDGIGHGRAEPVYSSHTSNNAHQHQQQTLRRQQQQQMMMVVGSGMTGTIGRRNAPGVGQQFQQDQRTIKRHQNIDSVDTYSMYASQQRCTNTNKTGARNNQQQQQHYGVGQHSQQQRYVDGQQLGQQLYVDGQEFQQHYGSRQQQHYADAQQMQQQQQQRCIFEQHFRRPSAAVATTTASTNNSTASQFCADNIAQCHQQQQQQQQTEKQYKNRHSQIQHMHQWQQTAKNQQAYNYGDSLKQSLLAPLEMVVKKNAPTTIGADSAAIVYGTSTLNRVCTGSAASSSKSSSSTTANRTGHKASADCSDQRIHSANQSNNNNAYYAFNNATNAAASAAERDDVLYYGMGRAADGIVFSTATLNNDRRCTTTTTIGAGGSVAGTQSSVALPLDNGGSLFHHPNTDNNHHQLHSDPAPNDGADAGRGAQQTKNQRIPHTGHPPPPPAFDPPTVQWSSPSHILTGNAVPANAAPSSHTVFMVPSSAGTAAAIRPAPPPPPMKMVQQQQQTNLVMPTVSDDARNCVPTTANAPAGVQPIAVHHHHVQRQRTHQQQQGQQFVPLPVAPGFAGCGAGPNPAFVVPIHPSGTYSSDDGLPLPPVPSNGAAGTVGLPSGMSSGSSASGHVERVEALFEYVAKQPDELNLYPGAVVQVLRKNADNWWEGEMDGVTGLFPSNYVRPMVSDGQL